MKNILNLFSMIILLISIILVSGCASQDPPLTANSKETPTYNTPICTPEWKCSNWSKCRVSDWECNPKCEFPKIQTRTCIDNNNCGVTIDKPPESQSCTLPVINHLNVSPCIGTPINIWSKPDSAMKGSAKVGSIPDCQNIQVEVLDRKCSSVSIEFDLIRYEGLEGWVTRRILVCPAKYNDKGCFYAPDNICNEKGDCPTGTIKINDEYGVCGECINNNDCPSYKSSICLNNTCVDCAEDLDCPSYEPACDTLTHKCVECTDNSYCSHRKPICYNHECIECITDSDCPSSKPICEIHSLAIFNKCIECKTDRDCKDPSKPACDSLLNTCDECTRDSYCKSGYHCTAGTCFKDY